MRGVAVVVRSVREVALSPMVVRRLATGMKITESDFWTNRVRKYNKTALQAIWISRRNAYPWIAGEFCKKLNSKEIAVARILRSMGGSLG